MKYVENPIYGRRVFFLNPPLSVENGIAVDLKDKEYEVYIIREYTLAKPILRRFPNAICWIFIDDELSYEAWCNFIKSFEYDDALKSIFIGVLTVRAKPKDQEFFMLNTQLPGGFVRLDQKVEDVKDQLIGILDLNGARGIRDCLRLDLDGKNDVIAYFSNGSNMFSFQLKDISPLGFAAITPVQMAPMFKKNAFIHNVSVTLGRYSFSCTIQIYHATTVRNNCIVVATFTDDTSKDVRKKIHDYVYQSLEYRYKIMCEEMAHDSTNYNIMSTVGGTAGDEKPAENQNTENAEAKNAESAENTAESTNSNISDVEEIEEVEPVDEAENAPTDSTETDEATASETDAQEQPSDGEQKS